LLSIPKDREKYVLGKMIIFIYSSSLGFALLGEFDETNARKCRRAALAWVTLDELGYG
jgi:hypothetical protein